MINNVLDKKHICIGCGICASQCDKMTMKEDPIGEYKPYIDENSCIKCKKCLKVCPFLSSQEDQISKKLYFEENKKNKVNYKKEIGYYYNCYEGYSNKYQETSASGGLATLFLTQILIKKIVDAVIVVSKCNYNNAFFEYKIVDSPEELKKHSKSAYYPVILTKILKEVKLTKKKYAIVVLPCEAKGLRLAMQNDKILSENIKIVIGLTCGGLPNKSLVDYIAENNNIHKSEIKEVEFRGKNNNFFNKNCQIKINTENKQIVSHFHKESFGFAYLNKLFHHKACDCCDDIYAECADIVFMDAWLKEYENNIFGTSIVITRNQITDDIMKDFLCDTIKKVDIERAITAQNNVGLIFRKKKMSQIKTKIIKFMGYNVENKRKYKLKGLERIKIFILSILELYIQDKSEKEWKKFINHKITYKNYNKTIEKYINLKSKITRG